MTERLYYHDATCLEFDALVTTVRDREGRTIVVLDRTAFYPTSGGQPFDTGFLDEARVVDVVDEDGDVVHVVEGEVIAGSRVAGRIDGERRRDHMQQHTGQHVLSAAFVRLHGANTISFHLGARACTIDLDREVSPDEITGAEREANRIVWENRPVSVRFASADEADALPLRKPPTRGGTIRLIEVDQFDLSACGGTHVARTGEIGVIAVGAWERYKGGTRVSFVCGGRALASHRELRHIVTRAIQVLSVGAEELPAAAERLVAETRDLRKEIRTLSEEVVAFEAAALTRSGEHIGDLHVIVASLGRADATALQSAAVHLVAEPGRVVVLCTPERPASIVAARSADVRTVDAAALLRHLVGRFGGKGGGRADLAQGGGLAADEASLRTAIHQLLSAE